jgi:hypothetical protein
VELISTGAKFSQKNEIRSIIGDLFTLMAGVGNPGTKVMFLRIWVVIHEELLHRPVKKQLVRRYEIITVFRPG